MALALRSHVRQSLRDRRDRARFHPLIDRKKGSMRIDAVHVLLKWRAMGL